MDDISVLPSIADYRALLARALAHSGGTHTVDDIEQAVAEGRMVFWPVGRESVVVTEIVEHPRKRVLHIFLAAGRMRDIERAAPLILAWGKMQGCEMATLVGRKGWLRSFLTRTGWTDTQLVTMATRL